MAARPREVAKGTREGTESDCLLALILPLQVKLLQSLGLKSTLITDGSTPINLFSTALGLLGLGSQAPSSVQKATGGPGPEEGLLPQSSLVPQTLGSSHVIP